MRLVCALVTALNPAAGADSLRDSLDFLSRQVHDGYVQQRIVRSDLPPYLEQVFNRVTALYPETPLRLHLTHQPDGNASALPDGGIYLRLGFLTQVRSSDELVFVLAHEAAHIALEHVAGRCQDEPRLDLFSVEVEIEADREAIRRMRSAGIPTAGVHALLTRLAGSGTLVAGSGMAERLERLESQPAADSGQPPAALVALQSESLGLLLDLDRERAVEAYLRAMGTLLEPARRLSVEAELARRRDQSERAEALFEEAVTADPAAVEAWRGLGLTRESAGRAGAAAAAWERVLELDPAAPDAPLIRAFIAQDCAPQRPAARARSGREVEFGPWSVRLPRPWRVVHRGPQGIVATPDSVELTRLNIEPEGSPPRCPLSMVLVERLIRQLRARPGAPVLTLTEATAAGSAALVRLSYRDETGLDWRVDLYALGSSFGQFEVRLRAPARHYHPRWAGAATAIIASLRAR